VGTARLKTIVLRNLVSPVGLSLIAYAVFLLAWVFPPDLYTSYVHEPDLMFLDPLLLVYFSSCVAFFLFGVRASRFLGIAAKEVPVATIASRNPLFFFAIPLILATAAGAIYLALLGGKIDFIALLASKQGSAIKNAYNVGQLSVGGRWRDTPEILMAVLWWSTYRAHQMALRGFLKVLVYVLIGVALAVAAATGIATAGRDYLVPLLIGLLVIAAYNSVRSTQTSLRRIAFLTVGGLLSLVVLFSVMQYLRGFLAVNLVIESQIGYTISSYNRMAALLGGTMHYQYGGRGVYLFPYLLGDNMVNKVLGLNGLFGWPDLLQLWQSETPSVALAGLNPSFIWSGVFGYLYADLGWWSLLYLFLTGILAGHLWWRIRLGKATGIILYAWMAFWIAFWMGSNNLFGGNGVVVLETAVGLAIFERFMSRRVPVVDEKPQLNREPARGGVLALSALPPPLDPRGQQS
jgi:hypothetical protein